MADSCKQQLFDLLCSNPELSNSDLVSKYLDDHDVEVKRSTLERRAREARWAYKNANQLMEDRVSDLESRVEKLEEQIEQRPTKERIKDALSVTYSVKQERVSNWKYPKVSLLWRSEPYQLPTGRRRSRTKRDKEEVGSDKIKIWDSSS